MLHVFEQFELDEENLTLKRQGLPVPLEPKALRLLLLLIRNQGRLLKREAIFETVWHGTVVEESSLTRAIALLRKQLGDDPRHPTFIETVPTLGYRFIAEVSLAEPSSGGGKAGPAPGRVRYALIVLAAVLCLSALLAFRLAPSREEKLILLGDFANLTSEPVFDGTLRLGVQVQLEQSPLFSLAADDRIRTTLSLMGQPQDVRLAPPVARDLCRRLAGFALVEGSIDRLGTHYVIGLRATRCDNGQVIDAEQTQAARRENVLHDLGKMAGALRSRLGESAASIAKLGMPLEEATTPSLDALQAYSAANALALSKGSLASIPLFERAVEIDPNFALAHAMLGRMYSDVGQEVRSLESTSEAYRLRGRASEKERFFIEASYQLQVSGDLEKALEICDEWERIYPYDYAPDGFRGGIILRVFGRHQEAAAMIRKALALNPGFSLGYHLLAADEIASERPDEARKVLDQTPAPFKDTPHYLIDRYKLAFLKGDRAEMERLAEAATRSAGLEVLVANQRAAILAHAGRLKSAGEVTRRAIELAIQLGRPETAARIQAGGAVREALFGDRDQAVRDAVAARALSNGRDALYGAALALALAGEMAPATDLMTKLADRYPQDSSVRFHSLPTLRAIAALSRKEADAAIDYLQISAAYELGTPVSSFLGSFGTMYSVFSRGQAFLALHRSAEAAAEFRKILARPGLTAGDPMTALAQLGLARALAQSGDRTGADKTYATLMELWKEADPDLPVVAAAKTEYARLEMDGMIKTPSPGTAERDSARSRPD